MSNLKQFNIPFIGLKQGKHLFEYEIDNTFFDAYGFNEFNNSSLQVILVFEKKTTFFELNFEVIGTVNVDCDTSLEPFNQKINGNLPLVIKFGQEYNDDNDEIKNYTDKGAPFGGAEGQHTRGMEKRGMINPNRTRFTRM